MARKATQVAAVLALGASLGGCAFFRGGVVLPDDLKAAAERPELGGPALLRAYQAEIELATWRAAAELVALEPAQGLPQATRAALSSGLRRAYGSARLFELAATSLRADWNSDAARAQLEFLDSWLGRSVTRALAKRSNPRELERFRKWAETWTASELSIERRAQLERLDRALLISQGSVFVHQILVEGSLAATASALAPIQAAPFRATQVRYRESGAAQYRIAADEALKWHAFSWRSLSAADLDHWAEFAESEHGQWFVVTSARAYRAAVARANEDLFQALRPRGSSD